MPADQQRSTLLASAFVALVLAVVGLQVIKSDRQVAMKALPPDDLQAITPFLAPLHDSSMLGQAMMGNIVVVRDPFGPAAVARPKGTIRSPLGTPQPAPVTEEHWVVSTILFEATKKSALVNNAWVSVGDPLGSGSRVTAVERDHIVVTDAKGIRHIVPIQGGEL